MNFPKQGAVLFSATLVRGHIAKFHIPYLRWFKEQGWETWVAAKNDCLDGICEIPHCDNFVNIDFARNPFSKQSLIAYRQLRGLFKHKHFDLIHTHTPVGSVLTRLAARDVRAAGTKVVYTAHGFHFYRGAPVLNWLLWYSAERFMSRFTDMLITINREDYGCAQKFAHCKVEYVPGVGVDVSRFAYAGDREKTRALLGIAPGDFALLSVGDLIPRKNQTAIVRALGLLPPRVNLFVCGEGPESGRLLALARELGVSERMRLLGFRTDIPSIMSACDCLVFPSVHEGLPVSVMEAMAARLPVVASRIRGIGPDLITHGKNGLLLEDTDPRTIASAVSELMEHPVLRLQITRAAAASVASFDIAALVRKTASLYEQILKGE